MAQLPKTVEPVAYTRTDAALATGLPPVSLDLAIKAGELPAIKSGRRYIILRDDLLAWLRRIQQTTRRIPARVTDDDRARLAILNNERRRKAAESA